MTETEVLARGWTAPMVVRFLPKTSRFLLADVITIEGTKAFMAAQTRLKRRADKLDQDWKDAVKKANSITWEDAPISQAELKQATGASKRTTLLRGLLVKSFPYDSFERVFAKHRFANDANVLIQEKILAAIAKKHPSLKRQCDNYFN